MFVVTEAAAIRAAYQQQGELSVCRPPLSCADCCPASRTMRRSWNARGLL